MDKLPVLKLRSIGYDGDNKKPKEFWNDIERRYPVYQGAREDNPSAYDLANKPIDTLQQQVMLKLSTFPTFMSIIFDIEIIYPGRKASTISTEGYPDSLTPEFKELIDRHQTLSFALQHNPTAKITLINSKSDEPFNIEDALSQYGHALISACGHASILTRDKTGVYKIIDPYGFRPEDSHYVQDCPLEKYFQKNLPGRHVYYTGECKFQQKREVCFLWSIMYLCAPELISQMNKIIDATAESYSYNDDWSKYSPEDKAHFNENLDIYVIAVMEEFVAGDQEQYKAMSPEEYSEVRSEAGGRRTRRRKTKRKTRHKNNGTRVQKRKSTVSNSFFRNR
jgi:hypothetical protein